MEVNNNVVKKRPKRHSKWAGHLDALTLTLVGAISCGCYFNSLNGDFVHDDIYAIKNNQDVTGTSGWTELFKNDFWGKRMSDNSSHKSYRPLTVLSFRLDYMLSDGSPYWFHVVNVILHSLVSVIFTWTCRSVFRLSRETCLVAGLLFALHPVHTEAVAGIVGRAELLAAIFFLLALISYTKSIDQSYDEESPEVPHTKYPILLVVMVICSVAAMLCKEQGFTVLAVCAVLDVAFFSRKGILRFLEERSEAALMSLSHLVARMFVLITTMLSLLIFRVWIMLGHLPEFQEQDNPASFSPFLSTRILTYNYLFSYNCWILLAPITLCYDWTIGSIPLVETLADSRNLATLVLFITLFMVGYRCFQDFTSKDELTNCLPLLSISLLIIPFLPASNLFFRVGFVIAERVLYLPSLGFCLLVGHGFTHLCQRYSHYKQHLVSTLVLYLVVIGYKTWGQNRVWLSREALFRSGVQTIPENAKVHYNYANYLKDIGAREEAIAHYKTSINLYPRHASVFNNLGTLISNQTEAELLYSTALDIWPQHKGAYVNLGQLYFNRGQQGMGIEMVGKALEIDGHNTEALLTMGKMMMDQQRWKEAEHYIKTAIVEKPSFAKAYNYYGVFLLKQGNVEDAVSNYKQAFKLDTHDTVAMSNAADGLRQLGRLQEAEELLRHSHSIRPDAKTMDQLALLYFRSGRTSEAAHVYEELMAKSPNNSDILIHYANVLMKQNELSKAEIYVMRVLSHNPSQLEALRAASSIAGATGRQKEAIYYLREAVTQASLLQREPSFQALLAYDLGNLYKDVKQMDIAEQYYLETLRLDPSKAKAHLNLGALYHLEGNFSRARYHYEEVLKIDPDDGLVKQNLLKLGRLEKKQQETNKRGKR